MELNHANQLRMPASCAVLSEDEMIYIEGGAFSLNISQEDVMYFTANVFVNAIRLLGQGALAYAVNGLQNMRNDGLTVGGAIKHYWGRQNTFGKTMTVVVAGFAGVYLYYQAVSLINTLLSVYDDFKSAYDETINQQQAAAPAAAAGLAA